MADAECNSQLVDCHNRRVTTPLLQSADVLLAEPRELGQSFLREASFLT